MAKTRATTRLLVLVGFQCAAAMSSLAQSPPSRRVDCGVESLQHAVDTVSPGTTVIVRGRCASVELRTTMTIAGEGGASIAGKAGQPGIVSVLSGKSTLSGVDIVGGRAGVRVMPGARLTLRQVGVRSAANVAIRVESDGHLIADRIHVADNPRDGLHIDGRATISGSTVERNGAGIALTGRAPVIIEDTIVRGNRSFGFFVEADDVLIRRTHVTGNQYGLDKAGPGVLTVQQSSFTYNDYDGITVEQGDSIEAPTVVRVSNSTFAFNGTGFTVAILEALPHDIRVVHTTIVNNSLFGVVAQDDIRTLATVISGNGQDCHTPEGQIQSEGWTLLAGPGRCSFAPGRGDLLGVAADLGAIATHGITQHVPLRPKSPGEDAVVVRPAPGGLSTCATSVKTDQRGVARPVDTGCDIGAIERQRRDP